MSNDMVVGVLGSSGFVGTSLMRVLKMHNINCIGGYSSGRDRYGKVDARDHKDVIWWIQNNQITHVVNLAAKCGGIGLNKISPYDLWHQNTLISTSVLEAARFTKVQKYIAVGTVCSYAKHCPVPFKEADLLCHGLPEETNLAYGISKLNALFGVQAYAKQHKMNACCLIPVNMYGPGDHFNAESSHVIPAIIYKVHGAIARGEPSITLWGTGKPTREFLYVDDFSTAVVLALKGLNTPQFINIGTGVETSIKNIVKMIVAMMGYKGEVIWDETKPDGQPRRCLDISVAKEVLGYCPAMPLETGLRHTINWYLAQRK